MSDASDTLQLNDLFKSNGNTARFLVSKLPNQISPTPTTEDLKGTPQRMTS